MRLIIELAMIVRVRKSKTIPYKMGREGGEREAYNITFFSREICKHYTSKYIVKLSS